MNGMRGISDEWHREERKEEWERSEGNDDDGREGRVR